MAIRRLTATDVDAAARVMATALPVPADFDDGHRHEWLCTRTARFAETGPDGCWVADDDGEVVGVAVAIVRDGIWGLSMFAVAPGRQAAGVGGALLRSALACADDARGALICSSADPRAMRLYARAGFDLRPCVAAAGIVERARIPAGLTARESDDVEAAAALSRPVRGGAYAPDDLALAAGRPGCSLLLVPDRGFAIAHAGSPSVVCAVDEETATDLLWSCFAVGPRGGTVHVDFMTSGQDWAIHACLAGGLALSPDGPLYTRGELGPLRPWLPSGAFL